MPPRLKRRCTSNSIAELQKSSKSASRIINPSYVTNEAAKDTPLLTDCKDSTAACSKYFVNNIESAVGSGNNNLISLVTTTCASKRLVLTNYDKPCVDLAKYLLGKKLVRILETGCKVSGIIVETEAYLGGEDKASHSYNGKRTERNAAMFMMPGTSYVYNIYGVYSCLNISSQG